MELSFQSWEERLKNHSRELLEYAGWEWVSDWIFGVPVITRSNNSEMTPKTLVQGWGPGGLGVIVGEWGGVSAEGGREGIKNKTNMISI